MKINELGDKWPYAYCVLLESYRLVDAVHVAQLYRPAKIYKYFSFSSEYWESNIYNAALCFNSPSLFNDLSDSRWFINYDKLLTERFKKDGMNWTESQLSNSNFLDEAKSGYEEDLAYLRDIFRISCFSETPYSNLMWGHYADKHSGFCLEYDVAQLPKELSLLMPVIYTKTPYDASLILDLDDPFAPLCPSLFKSDDWSYEREWRIFSQPQRDEERLILAVPNAISGIYLGLHCNLGGNERQRLEAWANQNKIEIYQIERSYCSFDLVSDSIRDIRERKSLKGFLT